MEEQASPASPAPRKRAWFQLHLSTCVVLMLASGVVLWANLRPPRVHSFEFLPRFSNGNPTLKGEWNYCGWPFHQGSVIFSEKIVKPEVEHLQDLLDWMVENGAYDHQSAGRFYSWKFVFANLTVGVAIMGAIAAFCESLIRRRRKSETST